MKIPNVKCQMCKKPVRAVIAILDEDDGILYICNACHEKEMEDED
jgi:hypothetical protein